MMSFYHRRRRLLLDAQPSDGGGRRGGAAASFDTNMVIILAALLCALICALGINSIIRFFLRCVRRVATDGAGEARPRFGGGKGLKKEFLSQIPVAVYGSGNGTVVFTECPICLSEFSDGEKIRVLPECHHCFHVRCVDIWLASHMSCPTCRRSLAEEQAETGSEDAAVEVSDAVVQAGNVPVAHDDGGGGGATSSVEEVG